MLAKLASIRGRFRMVWIEWLLIIPVAVGLIYCLTYLMLYGHLPQPYFLEPNDTFMDFFNPANFAHRGGAYDAYQTIYPPLSFVVLKFVSWGPCYSFNAGGEARSCDRYGLASLVFIYLLNTALIARTYWKIDRSTAIPRTFALCAGLTTTYALERGNVLLFCFTCVILAYGPLLRSARLRWLFAGLSVNFKIYLIGAIFAQLLKRRWRWFEGALLATALVYLVSFAILGEGSPSEIYTNITAYAGGFKIGDVAYLWYPSSLQPLSSLLSGDALSPIVNLIGSNMVETGLVIIKILVAATIVSVAAAAAAAWLRPGVVPLHRLILLSMGVAIIYSEVGGYTQMLLLFFVFMEKWRGIGRPAAIVMAYLLSVALDYPISEVPTMVTNSYFAGKMVIAEYYIGVGVVLRPMLIHVILMTLSVVTIRDVWADARANGWQSPLQWRRKMEPAS